MKTRILAGAMAALLLTATSARAVHLKVDLGEAIVTSFSGLMTEIVDAYVTAQFTQRQIKNLDRARDGLGHVPEDVGGLLDVLGKNARPLAKAFHGTDYEDDMLNRVIAVLVGLEARLLDVADELEDRSEGRMQEGPSEEFIPDFQAMQLKDETRRKVAKWLRQARTRIVKSGQDSVTLENSGKILKRRVKHLKKAFERLVRTDRKLTNAGL